MTDAPPAPASSASPPVRASVGQWLVYGAVRAGAGFLTALPLGWATALATLLARIWHRLDGKHRRRMAAAIGASLGVEAGEARRIAAGVYPHFAAALVDFLRFPRMTPEAREACVVYDAGQAGRLTETIRTKGAVFVTGHFGLWELAGAWSAWRGWTRGAIARPLRNPLLDGWVRRMREGLGQEIWARDGALRFALRTLRRGESFGMLADQDGGTGGAAVPFFGRMSSTMPAAVDLALRAGAPIIVGGAVREGPLRYRIVLGEPFSAAIGGDPSGERMRLLGVMNRELEGLIRCAPEQWIWQHKRWRTAEKWASGEASGPPESR